MANISSISAFNALSLHCFNLDLLSKSNRGEVLSGDEKELAGLLYLELMEFGMEDFRTQAVSGQCAALQMSAANSCESGGHYQATPVVFPKEFSLIKVTTENLVTAQMFAECMHKGNPDWILSVGESDRTSNLVKLLFFVAVEFDRSYDFVHSFVGLPPCPYGFENTLFPALIQRLESDGSTPLSFTGDWGNLIYDETLSIEKSRLDSGDAQDSPYRNFL